jgi:predicted methyltransferase
MSVLDSLVLSYIQTQLLLEARRTGKHCVCITPDLGLTSVDISIEPDAVRFPNGEALDWDAIQEISASENSCFLVSDGTARKIQAFSELTNQLYSLMPTRRAPTMLISGIPMHRIKGTDPYRDTLEKIKTIKPIVGTALDTATGLGYTAIEAAKTADHVITVELDPVALEIARLNPWSQGLFENPKITQRIGDCFDVVQEFDDERFTRVIHDPPTLSLAGHLYSGEFYIELCRVLEPGGRLFHYIGDPESKSGRGITRGVKRRLGEAGFSRIARCPRAFGVVAYK